MIVDEKTTYKIEDYTSFDDLDLNHEHREEVQRFSCRIRSNDEY